MPGSRQHIGDMQNGPGIFAENYGNGSWENWHTVNNVEYRDDASNTSILNNVIYNYATDAGHECQGCQWVGH